MENKDEIKMEYKKLGNSGIKVSRFTLGNWTNAQDEGEENQANFNEMVKVAYKHGVNFFDTAECYGDNGAGERILGKALKTLDTSRHNYCVATKIFWGKFETEDNTIINSFGTSRKHLIEGVERSLKNLELEYIDVLFCHRYDAETPTLETC